MKRFSLFLRVILTAALLMTAGAPVSVAAPDMSDEEILEIVAENLRILNLEARGWCERYPESDKMDDGKKIYYVHIGASTIDDTHGSKIFHGDVWVDSDTKTVRIEMGEVNESTQ